MDTNPYKPSAETPRSTPPLPPAYKFAWVLWIAGSIVIVLSWVNVVSVTVGWVGFAVAMAGTLLSLVARQRW